MKRTENVKWENGQEWGKNFKQERGRKPPPNINSLPHNFTIVYLDIHSSSGWHQICHSFLSGGRVTFSVSLRHVGYSGLK